jgi:diguanylate cyclase (GGDEF)-like protein
LTSIMEKHLESTQVLIMLPDSSSGNLLAKCSKGLDLSQFPNLVLPKESPLFLWIKGKDDPFALKGVSVSAKEERFYAFLVEKTFEAACRFSLPDGNFGTIFLGKKTNESPYDSKDLTEFSVLTNMAGLALKNIEQYKTMEALSYTDSMTGLYNYRYFYKRLNEEVFRAERFVRKVALVIFDIDEFKVYNDTFGHQSGDRVLKQLGEQLLKVVRSIDVVSRYGGDEFCVIMPETDEKECTRFMDRLLKSIETNLFKDEFLEHEHHITISLGGSVYPKDAKSVDRLIYCSDMALLRAKSLGKNKSILYTEEEKALKVVSPKVDV